MSGRHRKPTPTGLRLARAGALTALATIPLGLGGTAAAAPSDSSRHGDRESTDDAARYGDDYVPWAERDGDDSDADLDDSGGHHFSDSDYRNDLDADDSDGDDWGSGDRGIGSFHHGRRAQRSGGVDAKWDQLAQCESTQNWDADTGNGYRGGLQFTDATWRAYGGRHYAPTADRASRDEQIAVAKKVQRSQGWDAWPTCSRKLGYV